MSIWCSMMTGPMMTVQKGQLIPSKFPHIPNHHKPPMEVSSTYSLNFAEQENRTSLLSKVLLWAKLKPGCSFILFFWFMNRLISTSQQIKSVVRWFFPILQFNCGRDVSSQYFISTKMQDCPHFWPPYLSSERSSGNKKSPTLLLTKDISLQIYSTVKDSVESSPAIRRRPKQTLSLARLPAGRPRWWTGRFWKRKLVKCFLIL